MIDKAYLLRFKKSVSRAKGSYGYNTVTLYVDNKKFASTAGGGYDLWGTVVGHWIMKEFKSQIQAGFPVRLSGLVYLKKNDRGFYDRLDLREEGSEPSLDGGAGFTCMLELLGALGASCRKVSDDMWLITAKTEIAEAPEPEALSIATERPVRRTRSGVRFDP